MAAEPAEQPRRDGAEPQSKSGPKQAPSPAQKAAAAGPQGGAARQGQDKGGAGQGGAAQPPAKRPAAKPAPVPAKTAPAKPAPAKPVPAPQPAPVKPVAPAARPAARQITGAPGAKPRPQQRRRRWLKLSFLLMVVAPATMAIYFFGWIASDRYASGAGFAVRSIEQGSSFDGIGALTGLASSGSTTSESYIVLEYLKSRDLLERLDSELDLRGAFSDPTVDPLWRLEPKVSIEEFVDYWDGMIATSFDASSSIVTYEVQAFSAEMAREIADKVLLHVRGLVNELSSQAREDSLRFASGEVALAENRLRDALAKIREFRSQERSIDPAATAQIDIELLGALEARLIDIRARIAAIADRVSEDAPSMMSLRRQAEALEAQIAEKTSAVAVGPADGAAMTDLLATYETLEVEKRFAEQAYASALASLEQARVDAGRQQRYLAVFTSPATAEEAIYPERALSAFLAAAAALGGWGILTLIVYSIRDHMS